MKRLLVERIVRGTLRPSSSLNMPTLAAELQVSVTPLREALIEMTAEGFVEFVLARGFFVRPLAVTEVEELYPLLGLLEAEAVRSLNPTKKLTDELTALNTNLAEASDATTRISLDERWHMRLVANSPNRLLCELIETLRRRAYRYGYIFLGEVSENSAVEEHERVIRALKGGKLEEAASLVAANWRSGPERYLPVLKSLDPDIAGNAAIA